MVDVVSKTTRSQMMAGIHGSDTRPELFLRRSLHKVGLRYRLGGCGLPGRPDLVFASRRAVVFAHGCFWHMHKCSYFKWPSTNNDFWRQKIQGNARRDARALRALRSAGWLPLVVWECELRASRFTLPNRAVDRLVRVLRSR